MSEIKELILASAPSETIAVAPLPPQMRAAIVETCDQAMFADGSEKDVRRTIKVKNVPIPEIAPDEVLVAVMASSINFNTVWTALFEPMSTFSFLKQLGKQNSYAKRHDQEFHVLGSDASGVVVRVGSSVRRWSVGDEVVVHTAYVDSEDPIAQDDGMLTEDLRAWGYETNYGGLAEFTVVKSTQLMPKAKHLTWEEAASIPLCGATAYRMLVSSRGACMKQGDIVLIWGATGGLGALAVQLVKNGGGIPIGVVSSSEKEEIARKLGCFATINRAEAALETEDGKLTLRAWRLLRRKIRQAVGEDPHIVFEYTGRSTMGASVYLVRKGGRVVTCGSTSGYLHEYDNRYLWMNLKSIIGSHGANYFEASECNRLVSLGMLLPTLHKTFELDRVADATRLVQLNGHVGKLGILCMAEKEGGGVRDRVLRERIGESQLNLLRSY
ncbi:crotonyl-CoA reductase [Rhizobium sp. R339]|uniref:crotonyl-CoA carboxylase/reductase n=1 Tax=Rhizobium sp. R339 TaxID=1764273 RepID=UPI000B52AE2D|nr:crotonyl-CoA carboxylase/reductase [Rhizobium sp. R339]OWV64210.1 crotonyl-CoA reductase [Rhizobium sp. R339]